MDFNKTRPPATYSFTNQEIRSEVICFMCSRFVLTHQSKQLAELPLDNCGETQNLIVASAVKFEEPLRQLIYQFKYDGDKLLANDLAILSMIGWPLLLPFIEKAPTILVPVPLHWVRMRRRGYNQSELIAKVISKCTAISLENKALVRTKRTQPQQALTKLERLDNVANVFEANAQAVAGKQIILVDDVMTTGATLTSCAQELYRKHAHSVFAMTIACVLLGPKAELDISQKS